MIDHVPCRHATATDMIVIDTWRHDTHKHDRPCSMKASYFNHVAMCTIRQNWHHLFQRMTIACRQRGIRRDTCPRDQSLLEIRKSKLSQPLQYTLRQSLVLIHKWSKVSNDLQGRNSKWACVPYGKKKTPFTPKAKAKLNLQTETIRRPSRQGKIALHHKALEG